MVSLLSHFRNQFPVSYNIHIRETPNIFWCNFFLQILVLRYYMFVIPCVTGFFCCLSFFCGLWTYTSVECFFSNSFHWHNIYIYIYIYISSPAANMNKVYYENKKIYFYSQLDQELISKDGVLKLNQLTRVGSYEIFVPN